MQQSLALPVDKLWAINATVSALVVWSLITAVWAFEGTSLKVMGSFLEPPKRIIEASHSKLRELTARLPMVPGWLADLFCLGPAPMLRDSIDLFFSILAHVPLIVCLNLGWAIIRTLIIICGIAYMEPLRPSTIGRLNISTNLFTAVFNWWALLALLQSFGLTLLKILLLLAEVNIEVIGPLWFLSALWGRPNDHCGLIASWFVDWSGVRPIISCADTVGQVAYLVFSGSTYLASFLVKGDYTFWPKILEAFLAVADSARTLRNTRYSFIATLIPCVLLTPQNAYVQQAIYDMETIVTDQVHHYCLPVENGASLLWWVQIFSHLGVLLFVGLRQIGTCLYRPLLEPSGLAEVPVAQQTSSLTAGQEQLFRSLGLVVNPRYGRRITELRSRILLGEGASNHFLNQMGCYLAQNLYIGTMPGPRDRALTDTDTLYDDNFEAVVAQMQPTITTGQALLQEDFVTGLPDTSQLLLRIMLAPTQLTWLDMDSAPGADATAIARLKTAATAFGALPAAGRFRHELRTNRSDARTCVLLPTAQPAGPATHSYRELKQDFRTHMAALRAAEGTNGYRQALVDWFRSSSAYHLSLWLFEILQTPNLDRVPAIFFHVPPTFKRPVDLRFAIKGLGLRPMHILDDVVNQLVRMFARMGHTMDQAAQTKYYAYVFDNIERPRALRQHKAKLAAAAEVIRGQQVPLDYMNRLLAGAFCISFSNKTLTTPLIALEQARWLPPLTVDEVGAFRRWNQALTSVSVPDALSFEINRAYTAYTFIQNLQENYRPFEEQLQQQLTDREGRLDAREGQLDAREGQLDAREARLQRQRAEVAAQAQRAVNQNRDQQTQLRTQVEALQQAERRLRSHQQNFEAAQEQFRQHCDVVREQLRQKQLASHQSLVAKERLLEHRESQLDAFRSRLNQAERESQSRLDQAEQELNLQRQDLGFRSGALATGVQRLNEKTLQQEDVAARLATELGNVQHCQQRARQHLNRNQQWGARLETQLRQCAQRARQQRKQLTAERAMLFGGLAERQQEHLKRVNHDREQAQTRTRAAQAQLRTQRQTVWANLEHEERNVRQQHDQTKQEHGMMVARVAVLRRDLQVLQEATEGSKDRFRQVETRLEDLRVNEEHLENRLAESHLNEELTRALQQREAALVSQTQTQALLAEARGQLKQQTLVGNNVRELYAQLASQLPEVHSELASQLPEVHSELQALARQFAGSQQTSERILRRVEAKDTARTETLLGGLKHVQEVVGRLVEQHNKSWDSIHGGRNETLGVTTGGRASSPLTTTARPDSSGTRAGSSKPPAGKMVTFKSL